MPRVLLYSHDTYGLGHIRRTRAIANALVAAYSDLSVLIISGSPLAGAFNLAPGIDFVHVPGVEKGEGGRYASANLRMELNQVTTLREALIRQTAESFQPDVFIADKEPAGFRGELLPTLRVLKAMGTHRVIGIRDVLDEPEAIRGEWAETGALRALTEFYDDILVYGPEDFYRPLDSIPMPAELRSRIVYTGYLRRSVPHGPPSIRYPKSAKGPYILVTTGGGADGYGLIDWVLSAYEAVSDIPIPAVIAFGPFLSTTQRRAFLERIDRLPNVDAVNFDNKLERAMSRASAVVGMGGYNTFCEILSFDKPALIVPRSRPRLEQTIRAQRAEELGLVRFLPDPLEMDSKPDPVIMASALSALCRQSPPSAATIPGLLDGLPRIVRHLAPALTSSVRARESAIFGA